MKRNRFLPLWSDILVRLSTFVEYKILDAVGTWLMCQRHEFMDRHCTCDKCFDRAWKEGASLARWPNGNPSLAQFDQKAHVLINRCNARRRRGGIPGPYSAGIFVRCVFLAGHEGTHMGTDDRRWEDRRLDDACV